MVSYKQQDTERPNTQLPLWGCCLVDKSCLTLLATPWTAAHQAPLSTEFSRQERWSGYFLLHFRSQPRDRTCISCTASPLPLWCWRRLLRVPWTTTRSNQSILKAISPEYLLEGLMLKLQYFGHLMWRSDSLEKALMLGETEGRRRRGWEDEMVGWHHRLDGHEFGHAPGVTDRQGSLVCCVHGVTKSREQLNWIEHLGSLTLWEDEREQKQGSGGMFPAHTTTLGVGKPPRPSLQPDPWTHPYPHPL